MIMLLSVSASAYIDPGTGGAIIGSGGGMLAALIGLAGALLLRYLIEPAKKLFAKLRKR